MHQEQPMTSFLYRYESTSGLWVQTKLASPVSRPLLEAMNAILLKDGILAFIGTKSEYGRYLTVLENRREESSTGSWTSLPEATILATLGLCLNPSTSEGRSLVFHGSPRVLMLAYLIDMNRTGLGHVATAMVERALLSHKPLEFDVDFQVQVGAVSDLKIYANELQDSLSDALSWHHNANETGLFKRVKDTSFTEIYDMLDQHRE
jgi:hypothetical protein